MLSTNRKYIFRKSPELSLILSVAFVLFSLNYFYVCDDAKITFRVAENFIQGYGLTYNIDERVQAYSNPLWLFMLIPLRLLTKEYSYTSLMLSGFLVLATLYVFYKVSCGFEIFLIAVLMLFSSKSIVNFSGSGLENSLSWFLLSATWYIFYFWRNHNQYILLCALVSSLAILNRLDLSICVLPSCIFALFVKEDIGWYFRIKQFSIGLTPIVLWLIFCILYYGTPFPNTYWAKIGATGFSASDYIYNGIIYLRAITQRDYPSVFIIIIIYLIFIFSKMRWHLFPLTISITMYIIYIVRIGGDFMFPRMIDVAIILSIFYIILWLNEKFTQEKFVKPHWIMISSGILIFSLSNPYAPLRDLGRLESRFQKQLNLSEYLVSSKAMIIDFAEQHWHYRLLGDNFCCQGISRNRTSRIFVADGIGYVGLSYGPGAYVVDFLGLADPLLARLPSYFTKPVPGHLARMIPEGYIESIKEDKNLIKDKGVYHLYEIIREVTRGDIWDYDRMKKIFLLNIGHYDYLISDYNPKSGIDPYKEYEWKLNDWNWSPCGGGPMINQEICFTKPNN